MHTQAFPPSDSDPSRHRGEVTGELQRCPGTSSIGETAFACRIFWDQGTRRQATWLPGEATAKAWVQYLQSP